MANPAQCYYCFETLAASYKDDEPPSLSTVEELWERHEHFKKLAALQDNMDGDIDEDDDPTKFEYTSAIKPPGVRRLQSEMSLDSSSSNTPSVMSNNSSHSALSNLTGNTTPSSQSLQPDSAGHLAHREKAQRYPLFVTWNTISKSGHKSLRGCIGTFEAQELSAGLQSYALTSAFDDTRFSPIPEQLLPSLSCSLTLLGTFEPCTNALDWTLGVHGIRISFIHRGRRYGATYLPDVPVEQGWTKEETIKSLMQKAGWDGVTENVARKFLRGSSSSAASTTASTKPWDQVSDFRAVKYQGHKASATYAEWQDWRKWVLSLEDGSDKLLSPGA